MGERIGAALLASLVAVGLTVAGCGGGGSSGGGGGGPGGGTGGTPVSPAASGGVGSWAQRFLAASPYTRLRVELDYVAGLPPSTAALNLLQVRLNERCDKPGGVEVVVDDVLPAGQQTSWSLSELQALEARARDGYATGDLAVIHLLYLDGGTDQDSASGSVLGLAYTGTSFALLKQTCDATANLVVSPDEVEAAVLVHELGHLLGLVNLGAPLRSPHEDAGHPGHDATSGCVMFWQVETSNLRQLLLNGGAAPTQFDAACVADLHAAGGK